MALSAESEAVLARLPRSKVLPYSRVHTIATRTGLTQTQARQLIAALRQEGLISISNGNIRLTRAGLDRVMKL